MFKNKLTMTFENLQTISNVTILFGGILVALGGYGHYYFGKKMMNRRDLFQAKN